MDLPIVVDGETFPVWARPYHLQKKVEGGKSRAASPNRPRGRSAYNGHREKQCEERDTT